MPYYVYTNGANPINIFYTDHDPDVAARDLPDKHVVKMPVEAVQMLVSAVCVMVFSLMLRQRPALSIEADTTTTLQQYGRETLKRIGSGRFPGASLYATSTRNATGSNILPRVSSISY